MPGLTRVQHAQLLAPVQSSRIANLRGMSHLEAWDVRRWLIRIFGFTGWSYEVVEAALVHESIVPINNKPRATVVYRVTGRLRIRDTDGNELAVFEDAATGDGVNMPSVGDAHDFALKTAVSQALKRCAANLGDQFGLSLYNNGSTEAVVQRVLSTGTEQSAEMPNDPPVVADNEAARIAAQQDADAEESQDPQDRPAQHHRGPVDDEWNTATGQPLSPPSPAMPGATGDQINEMVRLLGVKRGVYNGQCAGVVSQLVRRPVEHPRTLSQAEANSIIETLIGEPDRTPPTTETAPAAPGTPNNPTINRSQMRMMQGLFATANIRDRDAQHAFIARILGTPIVSRNDLTQAQFEKIRQALVTGEVPPTPEPAGPDPIGEGISEFDALDQMILDVNSDETHNEVQQAITVEVGRGTITASDAGLLRERLAVHVERAKAGTSA